MSAPTTCSSSRAGRLGSWIAAPTSQGGPSTRLQLGPKGGFAATLTLGPVSTVLATGDEDVASFDLAGRPYVFVRDGITYRAALDGRLLERREARGMQSRTKRVLDRASAGPLLEAVRNDAAKALASLGPSSSDGDGAEARLESSMPDALHIDAHTERGCEPVPSVPRPSRGDAATMVEARARLARIVVRDELARRHDLERHAATWRHVGILPPDQYLSIVVEVTEGCSWNDCTFCELYRGVAFRLKSPAELAEHITSVKGFFGDGLSLRRSVFLGSANALAATPSRLMPLVQQVRTAFPHRPLAAFVDVATALPRTVAELRGYARAGLERVHIGLESGSLDLLRWMGKPGLPDDAVSLVRRLRDAGIGASVIVLVGAGGRSHGAAHTAETIRVLTTMDLGRQDIVYLSRLIVHPQGSYSQAAARDGVIPLDASELDRQCAELRAALPPTAAGGPRVARYDVEEFVY